MALKSCPAFGWGRVPPTNDGLVAKQNVMGWLKVEYVWLGRKGNVLGNWMVMNGIGCVRLDWVLGGSVEEGWLVGRWEKGGWWVGGRRVVGGSVKEGCVLLECGMGVF